MLLVDGMRLFCGEDDDVEDGTALLLLPPLPPRDPKDEAVKSDSRRRKSSLTDVARATSLERIFLDTSRRVCEGSRG